jgi:hypothetical protein
MNGTSKLQAYLQMMVKRIRSPRIWWGTIKGSAGWRDKTAVYVKYKSTCNYTPAISITEPEMDPFDTAKIIQVLIHGVYFNNLLFS